jgi:hypothetical protein
MAGAVIGVMMAITLPVWENERSDWDLLEAIARFDEAIALLETGLPL